MTPDLVGILEAGYAVETAEEPWLKGLLGAARSSLDEGLGAFALSYNAFEPQSFELRCLTSSSIPDAVRERLPMVLGQIPPRFIENARNDRSCTLATEIAGFEDFTAVVEHLHPIGAYDVLGINVRDPTGIGCYLGAPLPRVGRLSARRRATWARVGAHIAAAFRIQRRFNPERPGEEMRRAEAVLDGSGKLHHATGAAEVATAREALRTATAAMEKARTKLGRLAPEEALDQWKGLVAARWSLVEHFENDGKRYILACRNDLESPGPSVLSQREQQILGYAALGHETKLIAYELGISDSTVRVLLSRATAKLGARSRREAIATFVSSTNAAKTPPSS